MKRRTAILAGASLIALATACTSARNPSRPSGEPALVSPAELVASLSDIANGRNADMADTGLVLKTIELKLLVARENRVGGRLSFKVINPKFLLTYDE